MVRWPRTWMHEEMPIRRIMQLDMHHLHPRRFPALVMECINNERNIAEINTAHIGENNA